MHNTNHQGNTMGQILHSCAATTAALRRTIQNSQESLKQMAERYHINVKTVAKWRKRTSVEDTPMGPREARSTVLTAEQEAMIVAFRRQTLLPLDDCLYALQPSIPNLTRSSLHRCLRRHGISRLAKIAGDKPIKKKFKQYPIGYFHIDIAEVNTKEGRLYLFVAIDRTSKFAYAELHTNQTRDTACRFLRQLIAIVPYRIHTILTDNGIQFTNRQKDKWAFMHLFDRICRQNGIEHRLTKVNHPWTRRTSRADESNHQRSHRQAVLL
jgi:transposase